MRFDAGDTAIRHPAQGALFFPGIHVEPGLGGRVTFNLNESIAVEAEGNYFTPEQFSIPEGGRMFQGQFGTKIGKRFDRWGVFGKARPGFVGFSRYRKVRVVSKSGRLLLREDSIPRSMLVEW